MEKIIAIALFLAFMLGCTRYVPDFPVGDGLATKDSLLISIDTVTDGRDYDFEFDVKL